jgi:exodeoxyribonuclease III
MFKIITWNVNSLRVRLEQVLGLLEKHRPDVLALQETKAQDVDFPLAAIESAGYHVVYAGQKSYNGVALLSRKEVSEVVTDLPGMDDEARRVLGCVVGDLYVLNLYVPNGADLESPKYIYKLDWLAKLRDFVQQQLKKYPKMVIVGDFNIAPDDRDVYDPKVWHDRLLVSEKERAALQKLLQIGFYDALRLLDQTSGGFSWWDYRHAAFQRNLGLRIDLALISEALKTSCKSCIVDKDPRKTERPSDHAPVIVEL